MSQDMFSTIAWMDLGILTLLVLCREAISWITGSFYDLLLRKASRDRPTVFLVVLEQLHIPLTWTLDLFLAGVCSSYFAPSESESPEQKTWNATTRFFWIASGIASAALFLLVLQLGQLWFRACCRKRRRNPKDVSSHDISSSSAHQEPADERSSKNLSDTTTEWNHWYLVLVDSFPKDWIEFRARSEKYLSASTFVSRTTKASSSSSSSSSSSPDSPVAVAQSNTSSGQKCGPSSSVSIQDERKKETVEICVTQPSSSSIMHASLFPSWDSSIPASSVAVREPASSPSPSPSPSSVYDDKQSSVSEEAMASGNERSASKSTTSSAMLHLLEQFGMTDVSNRAKTRRLQMLSLLWVGGLLCLLGYIIVLNLGIDWSNTWTGLGLGAIALGYLLSQFLTLVLNYMLIISEGQFFPGDVLWLPMQLILNNGMSDLGVSMTQSFSQRQSLLKGQIVSIGLRTTVVKVPHPDAVTSSLSMCQCEDDRIYIPNGWLLSQPFGIRPGERLNKVYGCTLEEVSDSFSIRKYALVDAQLAKWTQQMHQIVGIVPEYTFVTVVPAGLSQYRLHFCFGRNTTLAPEWDAWIRACRLVLSEICEEVLTLTRGG